ncbi:hypothetical protein STW0522ENT66_P10650 (plasmid) [Enterobacter roggenkampii]|nr:hypothetical protein STW0522ENT66_P10650 [Enterobacter roggenkampii]
MPKIAVIGFYQCNFIKRKSLTHFTFNRIRGERNKWYIIHAMSFQSVGYVIHLRY